MPRFALRAVALFVVLLTAAGTGVAATASEFYLSLLRRGIASYDAGRFDAAARELDLAAFGLIESVDHFETAKIYAALANDRLGQTAQARAAAQRVLAAERVQRRFSQISLPSAVRAAFLALAKRVLPPAEAAALSANAPVPPAIQVQPRVTQQPPPAATKPPVTTTQPPVAKPQPQIQPPPVTTTPVVPAPQKTEPAPQKQIVVPEQPIPEPQKPEPVPQPKVETPKVIEERTVPFPAQPAPQPKVEAPPKPQTSQAPLASRSAPADVASRLAAAERHLAVNNLVEARAIYRELIETSLDRASILAVAEGTYRARDFATTVRAIDRAGTLNKGEEPYRYYLAVALYETGNYLRAKRELAAALPFIEITESVTRYRAKIEGAID